jgi:hypothetical protein
LALRCVERDGGRVVVDTHTGQSVGVISINPQLDQTKEPPPVEMAPPGINDPPNDAELQDLHRIADQKDISLQEAIDRYAWNDNFSLAVTRISEAFPTVFAGAEIVDTGHAWIAFESPPPKGSAGYYRRIQRESQGCFGRSAVTYISLM